MDRLNDARERLRRRLAEAGAWHEGQMAGRRWGVGCVSLEVTQRCNLDCELCYLSEHSEAVRDVPLEEIERRIDMIHERYGPGTDVQVSGGEPTLRKREELVAIVRRIAALGMRASLFTNGILAKRDLLEQLAMAGLSDVAFHVDLTQRRKGFATEAALNALRDRYIERARGLPLAVFFNTSVFAGNLDEIPAIVRFFAARADVVRVASFQLQADTGRGVLRERAACVTQGAVIAAIERGAGTRLDFDALHAGHARCNRYALAWEIGGRLHDALADRAFVRRFVRRTADLELPRTSRGAAIRAVATAVARAPDLWMGALRYTLATLWEARRDLARARGRINKLTFVVHSFMDAADLDPERLHACVFMAATQDGPLSMCEYNARRDEFLLPQQPARPAAAIYPVKLLKGRARAAALEARRSKANA